MTNRILVLLFIQLCLLGNLPLAAAEKLVQLNQAKIHFEYTEGNFENVTDLLETFLKSKSTCSQSDSVFLNKHLGVVYAASPATREKGKYFLLKMLAASSKSDLSDMFVSEDIDKLFASVKLENEARLRSPKMDSLALMEAPWKKIESSKKEIAEKKSTPVPKEAKIKASNSHMWLWATLGGIALIATGTYFLIQNQPEPVTKIYDVKKDPLITQSAPL